MDEAVGDFEDEEEEEEEEVVETFGGGGEDDLLELGKLDLEETEYDLLTTADFRRLAPKLEDDEEVLKLVAQVS